jgi:hypothetical protein
VRQGAPAARGRRWCTHLAAGASTTDAGTGTGTGAGSLDFFLDGTRAGTLTGLVGVAAGGVAVTGASTIGEAGGRRQGGLGRQRGGELGGLVRGGGGGGIWIVKG